MRRVLASVVLACGIFAAGPAWAGPVDPCLTDPVACAGEAISGVTDTVDETVGSTTDTVTDTIDEITDTGSGLTETVEGVTEAGVTGTIDGVTDTGNEVIGGATGGGGSQQPADGGSSTPRAESGRGPLGERAPDRGGREGRTVGDASATTPSPLEAGREYVARTAPRPDPGFLERIRRALTESAEAFIFPLALIGLVAAFLLLQSRFDRSDPKLALAPVDSVDEVLTFR